MKQYITDYKLITSFAKGIEINFKMQKKHSCPSTKSEENSFKTGKKSKDNNKMDNEFWTFGDVL